MKHHAMMSPKKRMSRSHAKAKRMCANKGQNAIKTNRKYLTTNGAVTKPANGVCRDKPVSQVLAQFNKMMSMTSPHRASGRRAGHY